MTSKTLDSLSKITKNQTPLPLAIDGIAELIAQSKEYLSSDAAMESLEIDPYWPKWNSPWWHMLLLDEIGYAAAIPATIAGAVVDALDKHYVHFFPFTEKELAPGIDPLNQVACHCQLGTMHQALVHCGVDPTERLPWLKRWYLQYQLPDGGLNCDERAYLKVEPKSSVVSSLPPLEAMLTSRVSDLSPAEIEFLDQGAQYLIKRRLYLSSGGAPIDPSWMRVCFPRFYFYDVLRGLRFVLAWACKLQRELPLSAVEECITAIDTASPDGIVSVQRNAWANQQTRLPNGTREPCSVFPLLEAVSRVDVPSPYLTRIWNECKAAVQQLLEQHLIVT